MAHELFRLAEKLYNTPHLITQNHFDIIMDVIEARNDGIKLAVQDKQPKRKKELNYDAQKQIGFIPIEGTLTYVPYEAMCGDSGTSYQGIKQQMQDFVDAGAKTIVLDVNSAGGEAYQMSETGQWLRETADANGVKLVAYVDGTSASAAYGLTASAHEVVANPQAEVGSIGVVARLRNNNKQKQEAGITETYVFAGKNKIPFAEDGDFSKSFLEDMQAKVNDAYDNFTSYIADMRKIDKQVVINTDAKMFNTKQAIKLGLVDKSMTVDKFKAYLGYETGRKPKKTGVSMPLNMKTNEDSLSMSEQDLEQLQANLATLQKDKEEAAGLVATLQDSVASLTATLADSEAKINSLASMVADKEAALADLSQKVMAYEQEKVNAIAADRKSKLAAVVPADKLEGIFAAVGNLEQSAFDIVLGGYQATQSALLASDAFKEIGGEGASEVVKARATTKSATEIALEKQNLM